MQTSYELFSVIVQRPENLKWNWLLPLTVWNLCKGYIEGDGFLVLETYECINILCIAIMSKHMPNVTAMAKCKAIGISVNE